MSSLPNGLYMPNNDQILAQEMAGQSEIAKQLNDAAKAQYLDQFKSWYDSSVGLGHDNGAPPQPPLAWQPVVMPVQDGSGSPFKIVVLAKSVTPLCDMPPKPTYATPQDQLPGMHIHIGIQIPGAGLWWQSMQDDTFPGGQDTPPVTSADGVKGIFTKVTYPFGGWYLLKTRL